MTRQHFETIAATIRGLRYGRSLTDAEQELLDDLSKELATNLAKFNPGFKRSRFLDYCGTR